MGDVNGPEWYQVSEFDKLSLLDNCYYGNKEEVANLVYSKVCVDEADDDGVTGLQIAAAKGHRNLVEYLLQEGADPNLANNAGMTPFLHACREGHVEIVKILWNHRVDFRRTTGLGVSALTLACAGRHIEVIKMLRYLDIETSPYPIQRMISPTPFMAACFNRDIAILGFLEQKNNRRGSEAAKADMVLGLDAKTFVIKCGLNYVFDTVQIENKKTDGTSKVKLDLIRVLESDDSGGLDAILHDPSRAEPLPDGLTPLMCAAVMGKGEMAEMIIKSKCCSIDAQENILGMTALMFAIVACDDLMVRKLLKHNAKVGILSTTNVPFSAIDLLEYFHGLRQDTVVYIYKHYLNILNYLISEDLDESFRESRGFNDSLSNISYFGKIASKQTFRKFLGLNEERIPVSQKERFNLLLQNFHINCNELPQFILIEDVLCGNQKAPRIAAASNRYKYIQLARNLVIRRMQRGELLKPFPVGVPFDENEKSPLYSYLNSPSLSCNSVQSQRNASTNSFSSKLLCSAQRNMIYRSAGGLDSRSKSSVSSCPDFMNMMNKNQLSPSPYSTPRILKYRSTELVDTLSQGGGGGSGGGGAYSLIRKTNSREKVRNAPSRPTSDFTAIFHQPQLTPTVMARHQMNRSPNVESYEPSSTNSSPLLTSTSQSTPMLAQGGGNRPSLTLNVKGIREDNFSTSSKSACNSPGSPFPGNIALDGTRTQRYMKRSSNNLSVNSPRSLRPKVITKHFLHQELAKQDLQSYFQHFCAEEVDENQFLTLKPDEIMEILLRQGVKRDKKLEDDVQRIWALIQRLNGLFKT